MLNKSFYAKLIVFTGIIALMPVFVWAQTPNDPFAKQWSYKDVKVYKAWDYVTGSREVVVAVIDNGFDTFHPDLRANAWKNEDEISGNGIDDDKNGYIDDVWGWNFLADDFNGDGKVDDKEEKGNNRPRPDVTNLNDRQRADMTFNHGTLVAGLIGAVGNNKADGAGINWKVKLMNLKVVGNTGSGESSQLPGAIRYAVDNGADVINVSMVSYHSALLDEAVKYAYDNKVVIVAAAGNNSQVLNGDGLYPICSDSGSNNQMVLGVSAIDESHHITKFSNVGSDCIDITAPGENISSTIRFSPKNGLKDRYGGGWSGTSFAAPLVSGAAALIKSIQPSWGPIEIYEAILSTVHHTVGQDEEVYAHLFGQGMLQIDKAIEYAMERLNLVRPVTTLLGVDRNSGHIVKIDSNGDRKITAKSFFKNKDSVGVYKDGDSLFFVTFVRTASREGRVEVFSEKGVEQESWTTYAGGRMDLVVGDVTGDNKKEIILAPEYPDDQLFRILSLDGEYLEQFSIDGVHSGVSLGLAVTKDGGKQNIIALYEHNGLQLAEFSGKGKMLDSFVVNSLDSGGSVDAGDIDGDGQVEYVVTPSKTDAPYIALYEKGGKLKRIFYI